MEQHQFTTASERNILIRGLFMIVMAFCYQLAGTLLFVVAVIQFVVALISDGPNVRLQAFGRSLAAYLRQVARFLTFASEEIPFPFSDWPVGE